MRYRLDDLGWYQFEQLVQGLLVAHLGLAVEAWGGRGDWGRDAWSSEPLRFPDPKRLQEGPFLIQVKFVENGNAAGARPFPAVKRASQEEIRRIRERGESFPNRAVPKHFLLFTNAPIHPNERTELDQIISAGLPNCHCHIRHGGDVEHLLDQHPELRVAYPELLGLRDLTSLLKDALTADIRNRSADAIAAAEGLAPVFVSTQTYEQAWDILRRHNFVVLDGPPEMGKTAVARMIGLLHSVDGWEVIDCRNPGDFERAYDRNTPQFFIADDAFGRTEYDTSLGRQWERALPGVLRRLNVRHRLAWTSRKYILECALQHMDPAEEATRFPKPAEVLVDANDLTREERARILYRHARASKLDDESKQVIKAHAEEIVEQEHFTPERIRRLVCERLSDLKDSDIDMDSLGRAIAEAIEDPTPAMRKSFLSLPLPHKWLLITLLESPDESVDSIYEWFREWQSNVSRQKFRDAVRELEGNFLRIIDSKEPYLDWAHPSYRDLVIEQLGMDLKLLSEFWSHAGVDSISLALSEAGGAAGNRRWPLLQDDAAWSGFSECCERLTRTQSNRRGGKVVDVLLEALRQKSITTAETEKICAVLERVCAQMEKRWLEDDDYATPELVFTYLGACNLLTRLPTPPDLRTLYSDTAQELLDSIDHWGYIEDPNQISNWVLVWAAINQIDHELAAQPEMTQRHSDVIDRFVDALNQDIADSPHDSDIDALYGEAENYREIARRLRVAATLLEKYEEVGWIESCITSCDDQTYDLESKAQETEQERGSDVHQHGVVRDKRLDEEFDVQALFFDL